MAKKRGNVRSVITLQCNDCAERNYTTEKNKRNTKTNIKFTINNLVADGHDQASPGEHT